MKSFPGHLALICILTVLASLLAGCSENSGWGVNAGGMPINSAPASGE